MRILYHAINGSGHGHLVRVAAIAERVAQLDPEVHQLVVTSNPHTELLRPLMAASLLLPLADGTPFYGTDRRTLTLSRGAVHALLMHAIEAYEPRLLVFDTHFPMEVVARLHDSGQRLALVLRRCRDAYVERLVERGLLDRFSLLLVPHERDEFLNTLPAALSHALEGHPGVVFAGPVHRTIDARRADEVRARHGISDHTRLIVVTCGAAGYGPQATAFLERGVRAALALRRHDPAIHVLAVGRPSGIADGSTGVSYAAFEPDLPVLYERAALVVAHAGYNTVYEILAAGANAVFVPQDRLNERQADTVAPLVREGRAAALAASVSLAELVDTMRGALARPRPAPRRFEGGSVAATALLAALPRWGRLAIGDVSASEVWTRVALDEASAVLRDCADGAVATLIRWCDIGTPGLSTVLSERRTRCYVDLGSGDADTWTRRALAASEELLRAGVPLARATVVVTDPSGGGQLPLLAGALSNAGWCAVVARVPPSGDEDPVRFRALEACRRANPSLLVDITDLRQPRIAVDRP
jgi:predicted glycosyltransferase